MGWLATDKPKAQVAAVSPLKQWSHDTPPLAIENKKNPITRVTHVVQL
jgi:hypothetical protein